MGQCEPNLLGTYDTPDMALGVFVSGTTAFVADLGGGLQIIDAASGDGCRPDLTGDGTVDTLDFLLFLGAWAQGDPVADWDDNGSVNTLDFLVFLNDWVAGC
jgi:hypothetical protein